MASMLGKVIRNNQSVLRRCLRPRAGPLACSAAAGAAPSRSVGYYYLLPEIPEDTAQTNVFMKFDTTVPAFSEIDPNKIQNGLLKLATNIDATINTIVNEFQNDKSLKATFDNVILPVEKDLAAFEFALKTARHMSLIYPYSKYTSVFLALQEKMSYHKSSRWTNKLYYKLLLELESSRHLLSETQKRLLDRYVRMCKLNGTNLNDKDAKICVEMMNKIAKEQTTFKFRLYASTKSFSMVLSDPKQVADLPEVTRKMMAVNKASPDKGPWIVGLSDEIFESFMKYSSNRSLRKTVHDAYYARASFLKENIKANNTSVIKNIVRYRKEQAKFFGYKNYAQYVIENKSAMTVENVIDLLNKIQSTFKPLIDQDLEKLQKYSVQNGSISALENHDLEYWKTHHTVTNYRMDDARLMQYFPLKKVMSGLIELANKLFGVQFKLDESHKSLLWNQDVSVYNVYDENNKYLSTLIVDPYSRPQKYDKIWSYSGRDSSLSTNSTPIAYLNMNVRNVGEQNSCMTFDQVEKLFSEFGKLIQVLLTRTEFVELSDANAIELDSSYLTPRLFLKLLYQPQIIKLVSGHVSNGEPLPHEYVEKLRKADRNFLLFNLMHQAYLSAFDLECHVSDKFWGDIMSEFWPKYHSIKLNNNDYHPCQLSNIFAEQFGCLHYTSLWSQMLALDIFDAFETVGFDNDAKIAEVGKRYRDTYLVRGASLHANELFRQFRGRNPSMDLFVKHYLKNRNE